MGTARVRSLAPFLAACLCFLSPVRGLPDGWYSEGRLTLEYSATDGKRLAEDSGRFAALVCEEGTVVRYESEKARLVALYDSASKAVQLWDSGVSIDRYYSDTALPGCLELAVPMHLQRRLESLQSAAGWVVSEESLGGEERVVTFRRQQRADMELVTESHYRGSLMWRIESSILWSGASPSTRFVVEATGNNDGATKKVVAEGTSGSELKYRCAVEVSDAQRRPCDRASLSALASEWRTGLSPADTGPQPGLFKRRDASNSPAVEDDGDLEKTLAQQRQTRWLLLAGGVLVGAVAFLLWRRSASR